METLLNIETQPRWSDKCGVCEQSITEENPGSGWYAFYIRHGRQVQIETCQSCEEKEQAANSKLKAN